MNKYNEQELRVIRNILIISNDKNPNLGLGNLENELNEELEEDLVREWLSMALNNEPFKNCRYREEVSERLIEDPECLSTLSYLSVISGVHPRFFLSYSEGNKELWFKRYVNVGNLADLIQRILTELKIEPQNRLNFIHEGYTGLYDSDKSVTSGDVYKLLSGQSSYIGGYQESKEEITLGFLSRITKCPLEVFEKYLSKKELGVEIIKCEADRVHSELTSLNADYDCVDISLSHHDLSDEHTFVIKHLMRKIVITLSLDVANKGFLHL